MHGNAAKRIKRSGARSSGAFPILCLLAVLLAACSVGKEESSSKDVWLDLLAHIPATEETLKGPIVMNDYARARDLFNAVLPAGDHDYTAAEQYWIDITADYTPLGTLPVFPHGLYPANISGLRPQWPSSEEQFRAWRETLGFTFVQVDQDLTVGLVNPPAQVLRGRFDVQAVRDAVMSDPVWSDRLTEIAYSGVKFYSWGNGGQDLQSRTPVRPLGNVIQLAATNEYLLWTQTPDSMHELIDAGSGKTFSLASREDYARLAKILAGFDTYTALIVAKGDDFMADINASGCVAPISLLALGVGKDEDGFYFAGSLEQANSKDAAENSQVLGKHVTGSVKTVGQLVTFKLYRDANLPLPAT